MNEQIRPLDALIGRLDRLLSEFLIATEDTTVDEADHQTLKHHAQDLIGVGQKGLLNLKPKEVPAEISPERAAFLKENPPWS